MSNSFGRKIESSFLTKTCSDLKEGKLILISQCIVEMQRLLATFNLQIIFIHLKTLSQYFK